MITQRHEQPGATARALCHHGAVENDEFGPALLHPLLAGRWSPASFDPAHDVAPDEIVVLLRRRGGRPQRATHSRGRSSSASAGTPRTGGWCGIWPAAPHGGHRPLAC